jgi:hypothetical protein
MSIQFLDLRLSEQSGNDLILAPVPALLAAPLVFGDIGLQIAAVSPANANLVRVQLWGYVKLNITVALTVTITIRKNGTPIFQTSRLLAIGEENIGFSAVDFPVPADFASGQIQYTAEISSNIVGATVGARNFSGMAAAGNFTG